MDRVELYNFDIKFVFTLLHMKSYAFLYKRKRERPNDRWDPLPHQQKHPTNHFEMVNGVFCLVLKVKMCMLSGTKVQRVSNSTSSGDTLTFYSLKFVGCVYRNMQRS